MREMPRRCSLQRVDGPGELRPADRWHDTNRSSAEQAYLPIVASGTNASVLHYV